MERRRETEKANCRSFSYKYALGLLDLEKRNDYEKLKLKYMFDPSKVKGDLDIINPLSLEPQNPWNIQQEYEELRNTIKIDVERIFPDIEKFQDPFVREIIGNVLFLWAVENSTISYRQGMHEIASIAFLIIENDMISEASSVNNTLNTTIQGQETRSREKQSDIEKHTELLDCICDSRYLEHDTFILFSAVMQRIAVLYQKTENGQESTIIIQCKLFFHDYLNAVDIELYRHMMLLNIEPQLFGMRWLRLLFARETDLNNVLKIWDYIILHGSCDKEHVLESINWIAVAILVFMRSKLLSLEYSDCLQLLMKYPQDYNADVITKTAQDLKKKYSAPKLPDPLLNSNFVNTNENNQEYVKITLSKILKDMKLLEPHVTSQMGKGMLRKMHHDLDKVIGIIETEYHHTVPAVKQVKTPLFGNLSMTEHSPLQTITQTAGAVGGQIISSLTDLGKVVGKAIDESRQSVGSDSMPKSQQLYTRHPDSPSSGGRNPSAFGGLPSSKSLQSLFPPSERSESLRKLNASSKSLSRIDNDSDHRKTASGIHPPPK